MFSWEIMSWLFKDPNEALTVKGSWSNHERNHVLTVEIIVPGIWLNASLTESKIDKWQKFPQTRYFLKKQLKFSSASWSILLCNIKTRSKVMMTSYHFEPKWENWSGQGFFQKNPKYKGFFYPFHCAKL